MERMPSAVYKTVESNLRILTMGFHFLLLDIENKKTNHDVIMVIINTISMFWLSAMDQAHYIHFPSSQLHKDSHPYFRGEKLRPREVKQLA